MRRRGLIALSALLLAIAPASAVHNGALDGNNHPAVGFILGTTPGGDICSSSSQVVGRSGVLIAEDVLLTTAEAGDAFQSALDTDFIDQVWVIIADNPFGPNPPSLDCTRFVPVTSIHINPAWIADPLQRTGDVAVMILGEPQSALPPAALPVADRLKTIPRSTDLTAVAEAAVTRPDQTLPEFDITQLRRRFAGANFVPPIGSELVSVELDSAGGPQDPCFGVANFDNGGGIFVGATNEMVALIRIAPQCVTTNESQRLDVPSVRDFLDDFVTVP